MIEFRILGALEACDAEGASIALGGQKQRALLALLLLNAGRVVPTDRLLDDLWGEHPPPTAQSSLQNLVSQLRKLLGRDIVVTRAPGYVLQIDAAQLDLRRFEQMLDKARELFTVTRLISVFEHYESEKDALEAFGGDKKSQPA